MIGARGPAAVETCPVCGSPVGATDAASRVKGAVTGREYDRAVMQVVCSAMQLWLSGKLGEVGCDG